MIQNNKITPPHPIYQGINEKESNRESNYELLRLLSMVLILCLHANFQSLGEPTVTAATANPVQMFVRVFFQQICEVGVNVFVLISGWFGIRPKKSSFFNLIFQVFFYSVGLYLLMFLLGDRLPFLKTIQVLWFGSGYWFVPAYIILYVLSPVINSFIDNSDRSSIVKFLCLYFALELIYGWAFDDFANYDGGYSTISFVGLYVLARYLRIYKPSIMYWSKGRLMALYFIICSLGALITILSLLSGITFLAEHIYGKMLIYTSPFVVVPSLLLVLIFSKIEIKSKSINWLASSCFAIYLIHQHLMVRPYYNQACKHIFDNYSGFSYMGIIIIFILIVALASILIDKVRILCWSGLKTKLMRNIT